MKGSFDLETERKEKASRREHLKSRLDTLKLGDLTKGFKNYSKDSGLDIMDSKKPLAVFTEGKSIMKAVS